MGSGNLPSGKYLSATLGSAWALKRMSRCRGSTAGETWDAVVILRDGVGQVELLLLRSCLRDQKHRSTHQLV